MKNKDNNILLVILLILLFLVFLICLGIGQYSISISDSLMVLFGYRFNNMATNVILNIRLPRLISAIMVGGGLSVAGACFQGVFSNYLATPDILGVSAGSSFGAVFALLFGLGAIEVQAFAFVFGLVALFITYKISIFSGKSSIIMMILSGMVVASIFQALVSFVKFIADPDEVLPTITFWLMGSLSGANYKNVLIGLPFIFIGVLVIYLLRWRLNILSLKDDEAKTLGLNTNRLRLILIVCATMITASSVAMCGQVGWIGLLVPHMCRMIFGSNNNEVIPSSVLIGAIIMMIIDTVARSATSSEIPLSILTAFIGAPIFILLLRKTGGANL